MKNKRRTPKADLETLIPLLIGQWRRFREISGPPGVLQTREFRRVVEAVRGLQHGLYIDRGLIGQDYFESRELLGAYVLYHWLIHYQEALALIGEMPNTPRRVLDVCSGPLPMAFAALQHGATEVIATDQNSTALRLGAEICGRYGHPVTTRRWNCLDRQLPIEGKFDLIIVGHCLEELFPSSKKGWADEQEKFLSRLMKRLTPNGCLLVVESSYTEANRRVLELRDRMVESGVPIQAPCIWRGRCPAIKENNQPCYAQREFEKPFHLKEIQRAGQINLSSLKMSYILFRNPEASWPELPESRLYRIISPEFTNPHGRRFYLCGADGKKILESRYETHPKLSKAFDYLRRGELISIKDIVESGNKLLVADDTSITIEAALNKPFLTEN